MHSISITSTLSSLKDNIAIQITAPLVISKVKIKLFKYIQTDYDRTLFGIVRSELRFVASG